MGDISISLVYFAFLALPGIIGSKIWEDFILILLFALSSYLTEIYHSIRRRGRLELSSQS
jgi:hypothetical protein